MAKVNIDLSFMAESQGSSEHQGMSVIYSDYIDILRARAGILSHRDRALMQMYLEGGYSFIKMARLTGVNEGNIARRIRKLIPRLVDSEYITCIRHRNRFSSLEQTIAKDYFVEGLSQKKIAQKRNVSLYQVRKGLRKVQEFIRVLNNQNRAQHDIKVRGKKELSMVGAIDRKGRCRNENVRAESCKTQKPNQS